MSQETPSPQVDINPDLLDRAKKAGRKRSSRIVIEDALEEYVQKRSAKTVLTLLGSCQFVENWQAKRIRARR